MKNILIPRDYKYLVGLVEDLKNESAKLTKQLGEYASHGGAAPFQIPEYQATDDRLRTIKERFYDVNKLIKEYEVLAFEEIDNKSVGFYSLVRTKNQDTNTKENFYIIHPELADKIKFEDGTFPVSPQSPVGKALFGKKVGDIVEINLPRNTKTLKIIHFEKKEY